MSKFDTHGGYFAPKDYMRVNEGGSHEENPNGGVQIGVDPEGNPNLLEEGEPVYKDYVYSDNIEAEEQFLVDNNLPKKYAGKLYSKIADDLFSEAEERPLDPISRNGLEVLLGRLADAQEGQKQAKEQADLEAELANLSPEELDQLEMMLAQGGQPIEEVPQEQVMASGQMPMMACGGKINKFYAGGEKEDDEIGKRISEARESRVSNAEANRKYREALAEENRAAMKLGWRKFLDNVIYFGDRGYNRQKDYVDTLLKRYESGDDIPMEGAVNQEDVIRKNYEYLKELEEKKNKRAEKRAALEADVEAARQKVQQYHPRNILPTYSVSADTLSVQPADTLLSNPAVPVVADSVATKKVIVADDWDVNDVDLDPFAFKCGGRINRYDKGGWEKLYDRMRQYGVSMNPGGIAGTYAVDNRFPLGKNFKTIKELEDSDIYRKFTDYVLANADNEDVLNYLRLLDERTAPGIVKLFDGDTLRKGWDKLYHDRRYDQKGGIYHLSGNIDNLQLPVAETVTPAENPQLVSAGITPIGGRGLALNSGPMYDWIKDNPTGTAYRPKPQEEPTLFPGMNLTWNGLESKTPADKPAASSTNDTNYPYVSYNSLPTWPRYAGAIGSGLLGLYNVFQQPDKYTATRITPYTPEGRIHMQNQVYNPIDQNMIANAQIAHGNATRRALQNSGMGPSTGAAILAADNNLTGNLGTGFIQSWDANNQRRNAVIAANNQAEAQRAQFDANMDYYRTDALNKAAMYNAQNDLMIQRLNNAAEGEKYAAISNQIANGLQALSGIGQENFAMNQINSNPAYLGYRVGPNGIMFYNPNTGEWETIKNQKS